MEVDKERYVVDLIFGIRQNNILIVFLDILRYWKNDMNMFWLLVSKNFEYLHSILNKQPAKNEMYGYVRFLLSSCCRSTLVIHGRYGNIFE